MACRISLCRHARRRLLAAGLQLQTQQQHMTSSLLASSASARRSLGSTASRALLSRPESSLLLGDGQNLQQRHAASSNLSVSAQHASLTYYALIHRQSFHASAHLMDKSDKEKKKELKAKAKAAVAAAEGEAANKEEEEKASETTEAEPPKEEEAPPPPPSEPPKADEEEEEAPPPAAAATTPPAAATKNDDPPVTQYSTPELTRDAARHKALQNDPDIPDYQNPLHHNNPDYQKMFPEDFDSPEEFEKAQLAAPPLDTADGVPGAPAYLHELADEMVHLTMLEMNELINKMADHYGFHEHMMSPDDDDAAGGGDDDDDVEGGGGAAAAVERTTFDVKLVGFDANAKIKVIKEVRAMAGLGLKEAKEMVEGAPKVVLKDVKMEQAEEIKAKLEELGAQVEIV